MPVAAPACLRALADATALCPERNRAADGLMGDTAHLQRKSDHNDGNAFDLTHDPEHGVDCNLFSRLAILDNRVKYVIWNGKIYNTSMPAKGWRAYSGRNPHKHHMHVSVEGSMRNVLLPWPWASTPKW
jgi:hypothetical protein